MTLVANRLLLTLNETLGYIFPALVAALVPIRSFFVSRVFSAEDLVYLDPIGETEEEAHEERVKYLERRPSVDEAEHTDMPGFSDFHASGIKRDMEAKASRDAMEASRSADMADGGIELSAESTLTRRHQANTEE